MSYEPLSKLFYSDKEHYEEIYQNRKRSIKIDSTANTQRILILRSTGHRRFLYWIQRCIIKV